MTFDHPDPSIYCVLASPTAVPGTSNVELGCFPPRWSVAEHTFRPPPFHRNVASEFLGLISGRVHRQVGRLRAWQRQPAQLHVRPRARRGGLSARPRRRAEAARILDNTLVFLFETQLPVRPTKFALETDLLERDYYTHWQGLKKQFQVT